ncbi:MAG: GlsB/YeaQ/YmgE family stress response membrane protein [Myxococcales bacterium]|nr:GlsB/YeaQ/YmgE family stress response membrane protein [Myxococcales bacterium]
MGPCSWIILGGLAGWVASMIAGTNARMGMIANILVGILGAFVGGLVMSFIGGHGVTGFNLYSFGVALMGATITLFVARKITGR